MSRVERERFQAQLGRLLETIDDPVKLYKTALGQAARFLAAERGAVVVHHAVTDTLKSYGWGGDGKVWDDATVRAFLALERPELPPADLMAPIVTGGRATGVMALRRTGGTFPEGAGRFLVGLCRKLAHEVEVREERRLNRVVDQIRDRTVRDLRPKDLFYQILHGLKSLTRYDHSSALLIAEEDGGRLVLHAEQIAWTKAKSRRIGRKVRVPEELRGLLRRAGAARIVSFEAPARGGRRHARPAEAAAAPDPATAFGRLLRWGGRGREPQEGTLLIAALHHENELIGVLKIAAIQPDAFGDKEGEADGAVLRQVA